MHVDQKTGIVRSVEIAKSTGVAVLDQSCVRAFKKWRFAVDTVSTVRCPVRFVPDAPPSRN
jgi:TonB family protein